ncbi:hypothetical protein ACROYT_G022755 [Oculina patagonica]
MNKAMLRLCCTASGEEFFELNKDEPGAVLFTKNHTGGLDGTEDHADGKIFARPNSTRCPVKTIKAYLSHLNPEVDALFQRPKDISIQRKRWCGLKRRSWVTTIPVTGIESYCERPTLHQFKHMSSALTSFIQGTESAPAASTSQAIHASSSTSTSAASADKSSQLAIEISTSRNEENFVIPNGINRGAFMPSGTLNPSSRGIFAHIHFDFGE